MLQDLVTVVASLAIVVDLFCALIELRHRQILSEVQQAHGTLRSRLDREVPENSAWTWRADLVDKRRS